MANSSECRYSRSIRGSRSVSRIQFPTCFRFRCSRTHVRGKEERETERGVGVCCVDTWTEGKQRMKEWLRESRERERACMYVRKRRKKIRTRSKKVKRCYTRREKKGTVWFILNLHSFSLFTFLYYPHCFLLILRRIENYLYACFRSCYV